MPHNHGLLICMKKSLSYSNNQQKDVKMFGKILYYDKKTVDEYRDIIKGKKQTKTNEIEVSKNIGIGIGVNNTTAEANAGKKYTATIPENPLFECYDFEKMLSKRDDYCDLTQSDEYDLSIIPRGFIFKADAFIEIPEGFDIMHFIESFKPILLEDLGSKLSSQSEQEAFNRFFNSAKITKIPLIIDADEFLLCAKINKDCLITDYSEIEEMDEQVTIVARMSSLTIDKSKPFYDPLKDFIITNRMMRRGIKDRGEKLSPITVDNEYRMIDILAIYK